MWHSVRKLPKKQGTYLCSTIGSVVLGVFMAEADEALGVMEKGFYIFDEEDYIYKLIPMVTYWMEIPKPKKINYKLWHDILYEGKKKRLKEPKTLDDIDMWDKLFYPVMIIILTFFVSIYVALGLFKVVQIFCKV